MTLTPPIGDLPARHLGRRDRGRGGAQPRAGACRPSASGASLILVVFLGGWELLSRTKLIDAFFFSSPSDIVGRLYDWITEGTYEGIALVPPLGDHRGSRCSASSPARSPVSSPASRSAATAWLADVLLDLHQGHQLDPARRAGADLHHAVRPRAHVEGGAVVRDGVLRRVRQRLPGRARGRPRT